MSTFIELGGGSGGGDMYKAVYDPQDTGIVLTANKEMVAVINKTGVPIVKGSIVYLKSTSSSGTHPEILLADADTEATSSKTLGAVYETIADSTVGYVVTSGEVDNLDTSMYTIGNKLWLSQTAGQVTTTPPTQPAHTVFIGTVTRSQNGNGRVLYAIQNGYELNELHDVLISSGTLANNDVLTYESSTALWKNKPASGGAVGFHVLTKPISNLKYGIGVNAVASYTTGNTAANEIILAPFIPLNTITIKNLQINVGAANVSGLIRILVYSDLNGTPSSKLIESTDISAASTGSKTYLINYTFNAGTTYWIGLQANTNISVACHSAAQIIALDYPNEYAPYVTRTSTSYTFGSAPASLVTQSTSTKVPFVVLLTAN